jgi:hypothetical protein
MLIFFTPLRVLEVAPSWEGEEALGLWVSSVSARKQVVTGPMMQEMTKEIASKLGVTLNLAMDGYADLKREWV